MSRCGGPRSEPGGRLIVGSYGSLSRRLPPLDLAELLTALGLRVAGGTVAGEGVVHIAWVDAPPPAR